MSSEQKKPSENPVAKSDNVKLKGLAPEPHRVQEQKSSDERSVALQSKLRMCLGLESHSPQDVARGDIQPTQAGSGLESHSPQERPTVEEGCDSEVPVNKLPTPTQSGSGLESHRVQEWPNYGNEIDKILRNLYIMKSSSGVPVQEQPNSGVAVQEQPNVLQSLLNDFSLYYLNNSGWMDGEVDNDSQEMQNREEDNGIEARTGIRQRQDGPPQQGTAGRRMRLQVSSIPPVTDRKGSILGFHRSDASSSCSELNATFPEVPLGAAKGQRESKRVSIASTEGTCMCGGMSLEGAESDVTQQAPRFPSLASLVNRLLELLRSCLHVQLSCPLK